MKKFIKLLSTMFLVLVIITQTNVAFAQQGDYIIKYGDTAVRYSTSQIRQYKSTLKANKANLYYEIQPGRYVLYNNYITTFVLNLMKKINENSFSPQDIVTIQIQTVSDVLNTSEVKDPTTIMILTNATLPEVVSENSFIANVNVGVLSKLKYITVYNATALTNLKAISFKIKSIDGTYLNSEVANIVDSTVSDTDLTKGLFVYTSDDNVKIELLDSSSNTVGEYMLNVSKSGNVVVNTK